MGNHALATRVVARVESPQAVAAKMPQMAVVVAVPRLSGWMTGALDDVSRRIRAAVATVVSTRALRGTELKADLHSSLSLATEMRHDVQGAAKTWCVTHTGVQAVEALCENSEVALDSSLVSFLLDSADRASAADRSSMYSALAKRVLSFTEVLQSADPASRLLAASRTLPWQAPAHIDIAHALTQLETDMRDVTKAQRLQVDGSLGASVTQWVDHYAVHERIAVVAEVAALSERPEVLERIGERAQSAHAVDPRLTYSLASALLDNKATPAQVLRPFVAVSMWNQADSMALASRAGFAIAQRSHAARAISVEP